MQKVEVINPYNLEQLEMLNDFCLKNNIENIAKKLIDGTKNITEEDYKENERSSPKIDEYLVITEDKKVIDYSHLNGEKDTKKCFLTFPILISNVKKRKIVNESISYAFDNLNMEEVFVTTTDDLIKKTVETIGFTSLGSEDNTTFYVIGKEEIKTPKRK